MRRFVVSHIGKKKGKFPLCVCVCVCRRACVHARFWNPAGVSLTLFPSAEAVASCVGPHCGEDFVPLLWTFLSVMLCAGDNTHPVARCCEWVISDSDTNAAETLSFKIPRRCFCTSHSKKSPIRRANTTLASEIRSSSNKISTGITMTRVYPPMCCFKRAEIVQFTASSRPLCWLSRNFISKWTSKVG